MIIDLLLEKQRATKTELVKMVTVLDKEEIRPICDFLLEIKKWSDILEGEIDETLHFVWPATSVSKHPKINARRYEWV